MRRALWLQVCRSGYRRTRGNRPAVRSLPKTAASLSFALAGAGLGNLDAGQQPVDVVVEALPRRLAVALVAHHDRAAGVEFLVEHVTAGELGAGDVPGQLVE